MPLIKSAIKKLRKDKKITQRRRMAKTQLRDSLKAAKTDLSPENLAKAYSTLDKAVKRGLLKSGTASRLKSRMSKAAKSSTPKTTTKKKIAKKS